MQCNMQHCQYTLGYEAISYLLYALLHPFFTYYLILSLGACS